MTSPRWLDEHEQVVWRSALAATALLSARLGAELAASDPSLSHGEYELLVRLSEAPDGSLRMSDLAQGLVNSRSRLTHTATRMEARGLLERRACPSDRRGVFAAITDAGRSALERVAPAHAGAVREHLFDLLTDEQVACLAQVADAVVAHLGPSDQGAAPIRDAAPMMER